MLELLVDVICESLLDTAKLLPFLFLTYLLMEYLEHRAGERQEQIIQKAGRFGPVFGAALGVVPQCGFSASAAGLYAAGLLSRGTLIAIFLSTSDEMLPILLSHGAPPLRIVKLLAVKLCFGILVGLGVDLFTKPRRDFGSVHEIEQLCHHEHCHCERGIVRPAIVHTLQISLFLLLANLLLTGSVESLGHDRLRALFTDIPVWGETVAALVGLIPNCASSVLLTELYLEGILPAGTLLAGLLPGAGIGLLVLFRTNKKLKDNLLTVSILVATGLVVGVLINLTGLAEFL